LDSQGKTQVYLIGSNFFGMKEEGKRFVQELVQILGIGIRGQKPRRTRNWWLALKPLFHSNQPLTPTMSTTETPLKSFWFEF